MKLWGGRFSGSLDPAAWKLNASIGFDQRLALQDVRGSLAWARALARANVLSPAECAGLCGGLETIFKEFEAGAFSFQESDEDIHTAVERRLGELVGPLAGKLHTGRSRNDQVATDLRLWLLDQFPGLDEALVHLQSALVERCELDMGILMPGYTHLQPAQPVLLSHWWLSHFWPLQRDRERLRQLSERTAVLPLGSGALAGTPFPIDRTALSAELGFARPSDNSIDSVSDRDFTAEFLFCSALIGIHLSKLAEGIILFSSPGFGFFVLSDAFSTGSSLMPQKKNPDTFELTRARSGVLLGYLTGFLAILKALPSAYDKDLQEDKLPVFNAYDSLRAVLPVAAQALRSLTISRSGLESALSADLLSTDLADYLVEKGIPFRQAHALVGEIVQVTIRTGKTLDALSLDDYQSVSPAFGADVRSVLDPRRSISRRSAHGGTAPTAVAAQVQLARAALKGLFET